MRKSQFDAWAAAELDAVESALDAWVPADAPAGLGQAMRYGVLDGGKRLVGMVSIGDLVKETISEQAFLIRQLEQYIAS